MAQIERINGDLTLDPDVVAGFVLPESVSHADETALWVQDLLQRIHKQVGQSNLKPSSPILSLLFCSAFTTVLIRTSGS